MCTIYIMTFTIEVIIIFWNGEVNTKELVYAILVYESYMGTGSCIYLTNKYMYSIS